MSNENDSFQAVSGELSIGLEDGWALVGHGTMTLDTSNSTDATARVSIDFRPIEKITIQEIQDLAVDEVADLIGDFEHGYQFSASTRSDFDKRHECDAAGSVREVALSEIVYVDVEVIRPDSAPFETVLPLVYSYFDGFRFVFGDSTEPLSAEAFWYFMFGCALNYCEADNA